MAGKLIGVLALQGAFIEHEKKIKQCGAQSRQVRTVEDLQDVEGLIIPGGESTAIGKQLAMDGFGDQIREMALQGMPIFGTCAGMILLSKRIDQYNQYSLDLLDTLVKRNAFGRQVDSFETDIPIETLGEKKFRAVFIRAPYVLETGEGVDILARYQDKIVFVRQGKILASAFHPELTDDLRVHEYFVNMID